MMLAHALVQIVETDPGEYSAGVAAGCPGGVLPRSHIRGGIADAVCSDAGVPGQATGVRRRYVRSLINLFRAMLRKTSASQDCLC